MKYVNDPKDPELLGIIESDDDLEWIEKTVAHFNDDLLDSGFEHHQFYFERRKNKAYIRKKES